MQSLKILLATIVVLFFTNCNSNFSKRAELEAEFKKHVANADTILYDGDVLHPTYAYVKKGLIIGLNFEANPECGKYKRKYFLERNEEISKIIVDIDVSSKHCGETYDSIYVLTPTAEKIITYSKGIENIETRDSTLIKEYLIDLDYYKAEIKKWKTF